MAKTLYQYNAETCQYERIRVKAPDVIFYISGVVVTAILVLAGMLTLHDFLFDSEKEIALRKENSALKTNHAVLTAELEQIESTLGQLKESDEQLHTKFFGTSASEQSSNDALLANKSILLADIAAFRQTMDAISEKSAHLLTNSTVTSSFYGERLSMSRNQAGRISGTPTGLPVQPWDNNKLVSGFGMRVNPFHKGLYDHPGVDIAAPRDSEVIATSSGTVVTAKTSDVQAGYGNFIEIDHGHGFVTRYAHLGEIRVRANQRVSKGMVIGTIGNSGGSIAPHLHYEVSRNGKEVDPVNFMIDGVTSSEHSVLKSISQKQNQSLD